jgi:predicted MFS family arabinose efflux permease
LRQQRSRFPLYAIALLTITLLVQSLLMRGLGDELDEQFAVARLLPAADLLRRSLSDLPLRPTSGAAETRASVRVLGQITRGLVSHSFPGRSLVNGLQVGASIADPDGLIRISTDAKRIGNVVPRGGRLKRVDSRVDTSNRPYPIRYARTADGYIVVVPLGDERTGSATIHLNTLPELGPLTQPLDHRASVFLPLALGAVLVLLSARIVGGGSGGGTTSRNRICALGLALAVSHGYAFFVEVLTLKEHYSHLTREQLTTAGVHLQLSVEADLRSLGDIPEAALASRIRESVESHREGASVKVLMPGLAPFQPASSSLEGVTSQSWLRSILSGQIEPVNLEINKNNRAVAHLAVWQNEQKYQSALLAGLADQVTVLLIAFLLAVELAVLIEAGKCRVATTTSSTGNAAAAQGMNFKLMRPAIFLFLFAIDISMAFLPMHMEALYAPIDGLSTSFIMSLPVSVEFLCVGISLVVGGIWLDRRGWHEPFLLGVMVAAAGNVYSCFAPDPIQFIISRGVVGFGYGAALLAAQGYVIRATTQRTKAQGLAHLFAGLYAGSICGAATGAMLAERLGYETVFLLGAALLCGVVIYALLVLSPAMHRPERPPQTAKQPTRSEVSVCAFLSNRKILAVILFSSFPASVAVVGFLNYFSPLYLSGAGASDSTIGQVLMLFGVCLTLLGPPIGRIVDGMPGKRKPIFVGSLIGGCAFLLFGAFEGVAGVALAIFMLGISNSIVLSSQSAYVLQTNVTRQLGEGKALGIFRATSRVGQTVGPLIFAWLITFSEARQGVLLFGLVYILMAFAFLALTKRVSEEPLEEAT